VWHYILLIIISMQHLGLSYYTYIPKCMPVHLTPKSKDRIYYYKIPLLPFRRFQIANALYIIIILLYTHSYFIMTLYNYSALHKRVESAAIYIINYNIHRYSIYWADRVCEKAIKLSVAINLTTVRPRRYQRILRRR